MNGSMKMRHRHIFEKWFKKRFNQYQTDFSYHDLEEAYNLGTLARVRENRINNAKIEKKRLEHIVKPYSEKLKLIERRYKK